jgi:predicted ABC-type transport system involved in lysophospholipase L1 biosynthesis ATPase subunit
VVENVAIPLIINQVERQEAIKQAGDMLEKVSLGNRLFRWLGCP